MKNESKKRSSGAFVNAAGWMVISDDSEQTPAPQSSQEPTRKRRKSETVAQNEKELINVEQSSSEEVPKTDVHWHDICNGAKYELIPRTKIDLAATKPRRRVRKNSKFSKGRLDRPINQHAHTITKCLSLLMADSAWPVYKNPGYDDDDAAVTLKIIPAGRRGPDLTRPAKIVSLPYPRSYFRSVLLISNKISTEVQEEAFKVLCEAVGVMGDAQVLPVSEFTCDISDLKGTVNSFNTVLMNSQLSANLKELISSGQFRPGTNILPVDLSANPAKQLKLMLKRADYSISKRGTLTIKVGDSSLSERQLFENVFCVLKQLSQSLQFSPGLKRYQAVLTVGASAPQVINVTRHMRRKFVPKMLKKYRTMQCKDKSLRCGPAART